MAARTVRRPKVHRRVVCLSMDPRLVDRLDAMCERKNLTRAALLSLWTSERLEFEEARTP